MYVSTTSYVIYIRHIKKKRKQGWKEKIRKSTYHKVVTTKINLHIQCNPYQYPNWHLCRNWQADLKFIWKFKREPRITKLSWKRTKLKDSCTDLIYILALVLRIDIQINGGDWESRNKTMCLWSTDFWQKRLKPFNRERIVVAQVNIHMLKSKSGRRFLQTLPPIRG